MATREQQAQALAKDWSENSRWKGIKRNYTAEDVVRLRGSVMVEHTLAKRGSEKLWNLMHTEPFVNALGALTGNQAMQQVKAGLKAIYLSGWQVAGDANLAGEMYPDQSLYPANSVPMVVKRINNTLTRADQIQWSEGKDDIDFFAPIVADAEAGFGGVLNAFELMKAMIEAGASGVHFEDQLASVKKCGHMGGKVLVPTREAVEKLNAARLAAELAAHGLPARAVAEPDFAAADIISAATLATEPLIPGAALACGVHLDLVGAYRPDMREADAGALKRALLVVDTRAGGLAEAGDVVQAIAEGAISPAHVVADLAELCRGAHPGRQSADQITAFKSVGWAGEDLAAAVLAFEAAPTENTGHGH